MSHAALPRRSHVSAGPAVLALALALAGAPAAAVDWARNDFRVLHGAGFEAGPSRRTNVSFQHISTWRYGDTFGFADIISRDDVGAEYYGELYTWIGMAKLAGRESLGLGPVKDIAPGVAVNIGGEPFDDDFLAWLPGAKLVLDLPFLDFFELQAFAYHIDGSGRTGSQVTPVWQKTFALGRTRVVFRGFVDFRSGRVTGGAAEVFSQPELLLDVGHWWGETDRLLAGMRWQYARNKFGVRDLDEDAQQFMVSWTF